jgi:hypothetical protein
VTNPYAAPSAGAEAGGRRSFVFTDEVRQLISTTATLMIIGGVLQMIPAVATLVVNGFSAATVIVCALFGVIPAFTAVAGFSLRGLAKPGDDLGALSAGIRALFVPFLAKGIVLLAIVGLTLLGLLLTTIGIGAGFFAMWD